MDDKIIVTHKGALVAKYGTGGLARIKAAIATLKATDAKRGLSTRLVFLDDARAMRAMRAPPVTDPADPRQAKRAIDAIFLRRDPEYLVILGSIDVVPHQDIANPVFAAGADDDVHASADLPYACTAPYSRDAAVFKAPSRVVGRLPDLTGAREPSHLLRLLAVAAHWTSRPVTDYAGYFGLSTASWRKSSALSLFNVFGDSRRLVTSPKSGPRHPAARLAPRAHFINCHGGVADPTFYGEEDKVRDPAQPPALTSDAVDRRIAEGTVASVECCYGAELYDSLTLALPLPICQRYLAQGAYAWFGSSTIAYGPAQGNGAADFITQYFLQALLEGASTGRAALLARQRFVAQTGELDAVDLKTLAQFNLLGDPSIVPAVVDSATGVPKGIDPPHAMRQMRRARRAKLAATAGFLDATKPTAGAPARASRASPTVRHALDAIAREAGMPATCAFTAFDVKLPPALRGARAKAAGIAQRYFVAVFRRAGARPPAGKEAAIGSRVAAVAKEVDGRIVGYRIYREK